MEFRESFSYDDVLLVPQYSEIASRSNVDLTVKLPKNIILKNPIVPANMKTVTAYDMAESIYHMGGMAIIHRFMPMEDQVDLIKTLLSRNVKKEYPLNYVGVSIGVKEEDKANLKIFVESLGVNIVCIDIAHGDSKMCVDMCSYIAEKYPRVLLIAGNVATGEGAARLWRAGADVVKVGIGPGSICSTRVETGAGVPQLTAVMDVAAKKHSLLNSGLVSLKGRELAFIADGGLTNAGNIVKALCFADMVMAGNIFAGTEETPGTTLTIDGKKYKEYVGSSTYKGTYIEGVAALVPQRGPVKLVMERLLEGVRSGCSYQGCNNLSELKEAPSFVRITSSGLRESHPHDVVNV